MWRDNGKFSLEGNLNEVLNEDSNQLQEMLNEITLSDGREMVFWALENSRKYSTSSLYKIMTSGGVRDSQMMTVWKCNIHLKVKISFGWQFMIESNLGCSGRKSNGLVRRNVPLVTNLKLLDHILFQ